MGKKLNYTTELTKINKKEFSAVYLVLGTEEYLADNLKKAFIEHVIAPDEMDLNFSSFDMEETPLSTVLNDAESIPFFGERRLIFVNRPAFLTGEKAKHKIEHDIEGLIDYLQQPSPSTVLVLFAPYEKLDQRKKVVKQLKKTATTIDIAALSEKDTRKFLQDTIANEGYTITPEAFDTMIQLTDANLSTAIGELPKLFLYATETKKIIKSAVEELISKSLEQNIFLLNEMVLKKQVGSALDLYQELLLQKEDPIKINAIMTSQFRLLFQVFILAKQGFQQNEIAATLKVHPFRVKLASQQIRKYDEHTLTEAFEGLIETEYRLKTGQGNRNMQFELFILQFAEGKGIGKQK
ncbi:DNA polymerase III subunit delta [Desemzia sp. RIT 804]|uniref:DNA polymerase III subunit delta n=1 Tax=Desemzia sp. RIT 804 TaxID=2810209 RepID=UPI00351C87FC